MYRLAEFARRRSGKYRVAQQLARQEHRVGLAGRDDLLGLLRRR